VIFSKDNLIFKNNQLKFFKSRRFGRLSLYHNTMDFELYSANFVPVYCQSKCKHTGIKRISIPKKGKKSQAQASHEKQRWFRRLQAWRAGGEGTISILKRKYGLGRSLPREHQGVSTWVGFEIIDLQFEKNSGPDLEKNGK